MFKKHIKMIHKIKFILIIAALTLLRYSSIAQDFNYQFVDTTLTYISLTDSTRKEVTQFEETTKLPIGFSFNYAGLVIDSLQLRSTGLLLFDYEDKYNFAFLNKDFFKDIENENALSSIAYDLDSDNYGRKIMKIEFRNVMLIRGEERIHLNFQVWLHQFTNVIEFRMGTIQGTMPPENYLMGLINMHNPDITPLGNLLSGSASAPINAIIPAQGELVQLSSLPTEGTVYKFTPASN